MINRVSEEHGLTEDGKTVAPWTASAYFIGAGAEVVEGPWIVVGTLDA